MQKTVIAKYHDGSKENALGIVVESEEDGLDVIAAVKAAATEYVSTPRGEAAVAENSGDFNYGDFANHVPDAICRKHGFSVVDTFITELVVDHDERIIPD